MIITIATLALHSLVLFFNQQTLLRYHAIFIAFLVVRLGRYKQPTSYTLRVEGREGTGGREDVGGK